MAIDKKSPFERAMSKTRLGHLVAFYNEGDPLQLPQVALVSRVTTTGMHLHVFTSRGMEVREYIRNINDPWYQEHEQRRRALREKGAWDTLENAHARLEQQEEQRREDLRRRQEAVEQQRQAVIDEEPLLEEQAVIAERLVIEGKTLPEIVAALSNQVTVGQLRHHFELNPVSA